MAAKKKTKAKTSKTKTTKSTKAGKSAKPAKKAKKAAPKATVKATKKKVSAAKSSKKTTATKKKAAPKLKKAATLKAKNTKKAKKTSPAPKSKKATAPAKSAKAAGGKAKKTSKTPKSPKKAQEKPAKAEIEKVLATPVAETPAAVEPEEVVLTDSEGRRYCRVKDCDQLAAVDAYCRYHYLLFWKKIQIRKKILDEGKLEKYIEELTARYPDKYLDMLRKDLRSEKEFLSAIQELEIDDNNDDMDEEDSQSYIDEVRGVSETSNRSSDDDY